MFLKSDVSSLRVDCCSLLRSGGLQHLYLSGSPLASLGRHICTCLPPNLTASKRRFNLILSVADVHGAELDRQLQSSIHMPSMSIVSCISHVRSYAPSLPGIYLRPPSMTHPRDAGSCSIIIFSCKSAANCRECSTAIISNTIVGCILYTQICRLL